MDTALAEGNGKSWHDLPVAFVTENSVFSRIWSGAAGRAAEAKCRFSRVNCQEQTEHFPPGIVVPAAPSLGTNR